MDGVKSEQLLRVDRTSAWLARRMLRTPSGCALCIVIGSWTIVSISCANTLLFMLLFEDLTTALHEHVVLKLVLRVGLVRGGRHVLRHPNIVAWLALGHLRFRRQFIFITNDVVLQKEICDVGLHSSSIACA
jgi:hypothetical protein